MNKKLLTLSVGALLSTFAMGETTYTNTKIGVVTNASTSLVDSFVYTDVVDNTTFNNQQYGVLANVQKGSTLTVNSGDILRNQYTYNGGAAIINGLFYVDSTSTLNMSNVNIKENSLSTAGAYQVITGAWIKSTGTLSVDNVTFSNNSSVTTGPEAARLEGGFASIYGGTTTISNSSFTGNSNETFDDKRNTPVYGGLFYMNGTNTNLTISNTTIADNTSTSRHNIQGGIVSMDGSNLSLTIENSTISNNVSTVNHTRFYGPMGGVFCAMRDSTADAQTITVKNTVFDGNGTIATVEPALGGGGGGVAYLKNATATFTDVEFKNNFVKAVGSADAGGAIFAYRSATVNINATVNKTFTGNYIEIDNQKLDTLGGFMYVSHTATANFNIAENATLTIGTKGVLGYDSIAGGPDTVINKNGEGSFVVNSSMKFFKGTLNINEGSMEVNSTLGASDIIVATGATLTLGENTNIVLYGCSISVEEGATLELGSNTNIIVNLEEDFTGTTNLFNIAEGAELLKDGESVTLSGLQDNITITQNGEVWDNSQWYIDSNTGKLVAVPEPSTYALIFGALTLGLAVYRKRK